MQTTLMTYAMYRNYVYTLLGQKLDHSVHTGANSAFTKFYSGDRSQDCKYKNKVSNKLSIAFNELIFPKTHRELLEEMIQQKQQQEDIEPKVKKNQ